MRKLSTGVAFRGFTTAALAAMLAAAAPAHADGQAAVHNLFGNLQRAGLGIGLTEKDVRVEPTLIRGMYAMFDRSGGFAGYINEAGTLRGDYTGMKVMPARAGETMRQMTPAEVIEWRGEVMNAIAYDKLIKVTYGDGGGRKLILLSAVDCGFCQRFEQEFAKYGNKVNTTFYVLPSGLKKIDAGGMAQWQTVSKIWCADDNAAAWKTYWSTLKAPAQSRQCAFDPKTADAQRTYLTEILRVAGAPVRGTPSMVREDGTVINNHLNMDAAYMNQAFGRDSVAQVPADAQRWLVAGAPQLADEAAPGQQAAQQAAQQSAQQPASQQGPKKIKLNDALKSLFN